jgi:hypothetical protein
MAVAQRAREASAAIAADARHVRIREELVATYAAALGTPQPYPAPAVDLETSEAEARAAFHLSLDAVNFGSGWFPSLRKRAGRSGYFTIALGIRDRGPWSAEELGRLRTEDVAAATGQDAGHELMALYARHLNELGRRVEAAGSFMALARRPQLADHLAAWPTFSDPPFFKRAQLTAYDMVCARLAPRGHEGDLTIFADNLVPHVLRVDGLLEYDPALLARIDAGELLEHGSREEVEIRACALHAVELVVAAGEELAAPGVDNLLWHRGQQRRYKALPRHRTRCEAY